MDPEDTEFVTSLNLVQEYLDQRAKLDDLLREGFFTLAKAKCEKSNAAGIFQITPTRACATKRIRIHGYKSEHLVNLKASQRSEVAGVSRTGSAKDFIRELSAKYHCDIGIDHEDLKSDDKNEGEIKLSNSLTEERND